MSKRNIKVSVTKVINIGNYETVRGEASISQDISDKADMDTEFETLWESAEGQVDLFLSQWDGEEDTSEETPEQPLEDEVEEEVEDEVEESDEEEEEVVEDEGVEEEEDEEEEEDLLDITEKEINSMTKPELVKMCKETEGMEDINQKLKLAPLRKAIIELLFEEEEEDEEEEEIEDTLSEMGEDGEDNLDESGGDWQDDDWQDDDK